MQWLRQEVRVALHVCGTESYKDDLYTHSRVYTCVRIKETTKTPAAQETINSKHTLSRRSRINKSTIGKVA